MNLFAFFFAPFARCITCQQCADAFVRVPAAVWIHVRMGVFVCTHQGARASLLQKTVQSAFLVTVRALTQYACHACIHAISRRAYLSFLGWRHQLVYTAQNSVPFMPFDSDVPHACTSPCTHPYDT